MSQVQAARHLKYSRHHLQAVFFIFSVLSLAIAFPAFAQQRQQTPSLPMRTLTVTGRGTESTATTITKVNLGVEFQGKTATIVQQEVARRSAAVVELLRSRNVEKLETTGIGLNPIYSYENNTQRLTGYVATNTVSFRVDTPRAGTIIDDAVKAGATRIDNISFIATDAALAAAQKQALQKATQDAQQQADAVFSALNLSRKEIIGIQINDSTSSPPVPMPVAELRAAKADASTPVLGKEQQVEASVTLQISY